MADAATAEIVPVEPMVGQVSIYRSTDPGEQLTEARERAKILVEVVREQGLAKSFGRGGKPHVQVEGWQFLGSQFGLIADIEWTRELDNGWEARAALIRLADSAVLTHAEAECRRTEDNWKNRDSYALRSMAQTRAVSKVFRNTLSSVMVMAGFSGTPAEEMDGVARGTDKPDAPASPADPHCPACLAVNGELIPVHQNTRAPYWKCTKPAEECAGASKDRNGKLWAWSGWHEGFESSAEEWLVENGYEAGPARADVDQSGGQWMQNAVQALKEWTVDERKQAYHAVVDELDLAEPDGSVNLTLEVAKRIFDGMHQAYVIEHPPPADEAPF